MTEPQSNKTSTGIQQNVAGLLCYLLWWITGIIFLIIEKENKVVRFHAWQSIIVFGTISILQAILFWVPILNWIIWAAGVILWIILMYKAYQGKMYKIPIAGNIAEQQSKPNVQK